MEAAESWIRPWDASLSSCRVCVPPPYLQRAAELPGSLSRLLRLILHSAAQYFIIHLSKMYISLLRALLE